MTQEDLEIVWERLAEALDRAGPEKAVLFLSKLALLLANAVEDRDYVESSINEALQDLGEEGRMHDYSNC